MTFENIHSLFYKNERNTNQIWRSIKIGSWDISGGSKGAPGMRPQLGVQIL